MPKKKEKASKDWSKPTEVSDVMLAFPGDVIGNLIPEWDEIPKKYRDNWTDQTFISDWFYSGVKIDEIVGEKGVDIQMALRQISAAIKSFQPPHQHKMAALNYLCDLWFEQIKYTRRDS